MLRNSHKTQELLVAACAVDLGDPEELKIAGRARAALLWDPGGREGPRGMLSPRVLGHLPQVSLNPAPNPLLAPATRTSSGL